MDAQAELTRGRAAWRRGDWPETREALARADRAVGLDADDLWLHALAAYLTGHDDEFQADLERAHLKYLEHDDAAAAVRCAFWLGMRLANTGEMARAGGWLARAGRLLEGAPVDCVERGYLLLPRIMQQLDQRDYAAASAAAAEALEIGTRCADADLLAFGLHLQGRALIGLHRIDDGLAMLDEAMVGVETGELSPQVTGLIYCSMIGACRRIHALHRVREWTAALTDWCAQQPDMVPFTGQCLVYRAEILQLHGAWRDAIAEARRAGERSAAAADAAAGAAAHYQEGEVHRLLGDFDAAEAAYREANRAGTEPQPGLALLRLAQGRTDAAASAIRRAVAEADDPLRRSRLLPACVEILLAAGDAEGARTACRELDGVARDYSSSVLGTMLAHASGAVALADGDALEALGQLRHARQGWEDLKAPYEAARVRVLIGRACRELGDIDSAELEIAAARDVFERLGAEPDLARIGSAQRRSHAAAPYGLTPREREVLSLLATGRTNRAIAADLFISDRTVARHVANIFGKLGVSSRAAATALALRNEIVTPSA